MSKLEIITMKEQGMSIRAIAAELKMGRRTVSKYWNEYLETKAALMEDPGNLELQEKLVQKPVYTTTKPRLLLKYTQAIDQRLDEILADEAKKNKELGSHKQKLTALAIYEIIKSEGHDIGRSTITNYLRIKREKQSEVFIKQKYKLGNRIEFDFGEVKVWHPCEKVYARCFLESGNKLSVGTII
ncbi:helix-turn-helix domain-containing protein [Culicoidibacter larvae]|uniref:Resolvase HTH domain-containing protein n=1 Tax=Culicoidibacter larvae TaxID=2579976 RepID=A0A5R8Q6J6_9FIRM|nr:helix-turn-helix domain-containing protein [Culicoidibacter larvae]TLG70282.1 hypothetical protein FEZ08_11885 [Culicoidibacter larvae]